MSSRPAKDKAAKATSANSPAVAETPPGRSSLLWLEISVCMGRLRERRNSPFRENNDHLIAAAIQILRPPEHNCASMIGQNTHSTPPLWTKFPFTALIFTLRSNFRIRLSYL